MPILNLDKLFYPRAVAVIGASNREAAPGHIVMQNLLQGGFEGPIMPVSRDDRAIAGVLAYSAIDDLPETPDLAVVCDGRERLPAAIRALGERGTRAAILLGDGAAPLARNGGRAHQPLLQEAERFGLRILGPDCLGLMVPHIGLNASVAPAAAVPGGVAFVSQSSTVCAAILDWARERDIGFSHFISLGETADIDFGDVIDYLGNDAMTRAILLYIESIKSGRKFMSAGRGASRNKPILVIKAGRTPEGQRSAFGAVDAAVADDIYDSAIRRAGMLRVHRFGELFAAVETLGRSRPLRGERLAIVSNGIGIAVMAVDALVLSGGKLAPLTDDCRQALAPLFAQRGCDNPVHLAEDAAPDHYAAAVKTLIASQRVDAVLVLHAPSSAVSSSRVADAVIRAAKEARGGAVLASFMGGQRVAEARRLFGEARIPSFDTVNEAIEAFMHMVRYRRNQDMLMETPASMPDEFSVDADGARLLVADHLRHGRSILTGTDAQALLATYGIASAGSRTAASPLEAANAAAALGFPVRLRLMADGVRDTDDAATLTSKAAVLAAAEHLLATARQQITGGKAGRFLIERGPAWSGGHEARIGVVDDPVFGPVITFGQGGEAADVIDDRAVALPPLNAGLAQELIARTRLYRLMRGYGSRPAANLDALCSTLVRISQMVVDVPEIAALDINPVLVNERGVCAGDSQILIAPATEVTEQRLAIRPYPKELEEPFALVNGRTVLLRPIRPEDEPAHYELLSKCTPEDMRLRFFHPIRTLPHTEMARLTQIDYDREMAFLATAPKADGSGPETLGVVRTVTDLSNDKAEYAILVRSDIKRQRLGWKLMEKMVRYCRSRGTRRIVGQVLRDNVRMLDLVASLGFRRRKVLDEDLMEVELNLQEPPAPPPGNGATAATGQ
jgi:acetyltransferase